MQQRIGAGDEEGSPSVPASVGGFLTPGRDTLREATVGSTFVLAAASAAGLVVLGVAIRRRSRS